jgi:hypothetical protein
MTKRTRDSNHWSTDPLALPRKTNRRRTAAYLERNAKQESGLESCQFFELHLGFAASANSGGSCQTSPSVPTSHHILRELRTSRQHFEEEHKCYCAGLRRDAQDAIEVAEAFHAFLSVFGSENASLLTSMLNIGDESTSALKAKISEYAGVPSNLDLLDWSSLHALLR